MKNRTLRISIFPIRKSTCGSVDVKARNAI